MKGKALKIFKRMGKRPTPKNIKWSDVLLVLKQLGCVEGKASGSHLKFSFETIGAYDMDYKGYKASIKYDADDDLFYGRVAGISDVVSFDGRSVAELKREFKATVDEYLEFCREKGKEPDKVFSGNLRVRFSPELHKALSFLADDKEVSLNDLIVSACERIVES